LEQIIKLVFRFAIGLIYTIFLSVFSLYVQFQSWFLQSNNIDFAVFFATPKNAANQANNAILLLQLLLFKLKK
jgi:hypothetical protein